MTVSEVSRCSNNKIRVSQRVSDLMAPAIRSIVQPVHRGVTALKNETRFTSLRALQGAHTHIKQLSSLLFPFPLLSVPFPFLLFSFSFSHSISSFYSSSESDNSEQVFLKCILEPCLNSVHGFDFKCKSSRRGGGGEEEEEGRWRSRRGGVGRRSTGGGVREDEYRYNFVFVIVMTFAPSLLTFVFMWTSIVCTPHLSLANATPEMKTSAFPFLVSQSQRFLSPHGIVL